MITNVFQRHLSASSFSVIVVFMTSLFPCPDSLNFAWKREREKRVRQSVTTCIWCWTSSSLSIPIGLSIVVNFFVSAKQDNVEAGWGKLWRIFLILLWSIHLLKRCRGPSGNLVRLRRVNAEEVARCCRFHILPPGICHLGILMGKPIQSSKNLRIHLKFRSGGILRNQKVWSGQKSYEKFNCEICGNYP